MGDVKRYSNELRHGNFNPLVEKPDGTYVLHADYAALLVRHNALKDVAVHIYNSGYHAGHHCTVDGGYVDIHSSDMDTYHAEEVAELLAALAEVDRLLKEEL